jgi:hypothetical protein
VKTGGPEKGRRVLLFVQPSSGLDIGRSALRGSAFFNTADPHSSLRQRLGAGDRAFYHGLLAEWSPSRAVSGVGSVAATESGGDAGDL